MIPLIKKFVKRLHLELEDMTKEKVDFIILDSDIGKINMIFHACHEIRACILVLKYSMSIRMLTTNVCSGWVIRCTFLFIRLSMICTVLSLTFLQCVRRCGWVLMFLQAVLSSDCFYLLRRIRHK